MSSSIPLSRTVLERAITPEYLRILAVLRIALISGITFFFIGVFIIYSMMRPGAQSVTNSSLIDILSMINLMLAAGALMTSTFIYRSMIDPARFMSAVSLPQEEVVRNVLAAYRTATILFIAPLEGAAFFSLVVLIIAAQSTALFWHPVYWLNGGPALLMVIAGVYTFPTKERCLAAFF